MKRPLAKYVFILILIYSLGCQPLEKENAVTDPFKQIKDSKAKSVLIKTIKNAGGLDTWQRIKNLTYVKHGILYFADGSIEKDNVQLHRYKFYLNFQLK